MGSLGSMASMGSMGRMRLLAGARGYGVRVTAGRGAWVPQRTASRHSSSLPSPPSTTASNTVPSDYNLPFGKQSLFIPTMPGHQSFAPAPSSSSPAASTFLTAATVPSSTAASQPQTVKNEVPIRDESTSTLAAGAPASSASKPTAVSPPTPITRPSAPKYRHGNNSDTSWQPQPENYGHSNRPIPAEKTIYDEITRDELTLSPDEPGSEELEGSMQTAATVEPNDEDVIYVLGGNPHATYLCHLLAGVPNIPPVRFLLFSRHFAKKWRMEGGRVQVLRGGVRLPPNPVTGEFVKKPTDDMFVPDTKPANRYSRRKAEAPHMQPIRNLVITEACVASVGSVSRIAHRLDQNSTICLVQQGLGVVERLNELYFPDPATRPRYILAHMTHDLGYTDSSFTVAELKPGNLMLSLYTPPDELSNEVSTGLSAIKATESESSSAVEQNVGGDVEVSAEAPVNDGSRFMHLLGVAPTLGTGFYHQGAFLLRKLPDMIAVCASEPVATVLNLPLGNAIMGNAEARILVEWLVMELIGVVKAMPETQQHAKLAEFVNSGRLQRQIMQKLHSHDQNRPRRPGHRMLGNGSGSSDIAVGTSDNAGMCRMALRTALGRRADIQFLNGYFVRRGQALGIACPMNEMIIRLVQARRIANQSTLADRIDIDGHSGHQFGSYRGLAPPEQDVPQEPQPYVSAAGKFKWRNENKGARRGDPAADDAPAAAASSLP